MNKLQVATCQGKKHHSRILATVLAAMLIFPTGMVWADSWKDESGHGRYYSHHHDDDRDDDYWEAREDYLEAREEYQEAREEYLEERRGDGRYEYHERYDRDRYDDFDREELSYGSREIDNIANQVINEVARQLLN